MAIRTVKHAPAPAFREAGNVGQVVDDAGREDQPPPLDFALAGRDDEPVRAAGGRVGETIDPFHRRIGEKLRAAVGDDIGGCAAVMAEETVRSVGETIAALAAVDYRDPAPRAGELKRGRK